MGAVADGVQRKTYTVGGGGPHRIEGCIQRDTTFGFTALNVNSCFSFSVYIY